MVKYPASILNIIKVLGNRRKKKDPFIPTKVLKKTIYAKSDAAVTKRVKQLNEWNLIRSKIVKNKKCYTLTKIGLNMYKELRKDLGL
ncbi:MAG: hypothetical protein ACFFFG_02280 [Candidatus Thorarchaeota archaeon]